jgi:2-phosphoglycerate kinase
MVAVGDTASVPGIERWQAGRFAWKRFVARKFFVETASGEKNPFLRGVLVESLVRSGLPFEDAYLLAQTARDQLESKSKVTTETLKQWVIAELQQRFGDARAAAYALGSSKDQQVMVRTSTELAPFSAGLLARSIEACAIERTVALEAAKQTHDDLRKAGTEIVDTVDLRQIVERCLRRHCSASAADRYLAWQRFRASGLPLILLIGGVTGTGKSTLTTELAYKLNIVRTQSTDMMREIVRCYLPRDRIATLDYSSFEAWRGLTDSGRSAGDIDPRRVIEGFISQFENVKDGLEATIQRAVKEVQDLIVDGVHILPARLDLDVARDRAIVVPLMLIVPNKETLSKRLTHRASEQTERPSSHYLDGLDRIWTLQSFLLAEAEDRGVPLIVNSDVDEALSELLMEISIKISRHFPPGT